jgi:hypothetical protein
VNYQCITAIASVVQDFLLLASAVLIGWYLYETRRMRQAADEQVRETQALVKTSQEQLEAQIMPAIAVHAKGSPHGLELVNVGKGPVLGVILSAAERGSTGTRGLDRFVNNDIAFIAAGGKESTSVRTQDIGVGGVPVLNGRSLQCQYTSLSGRTYWTVVDFDHASGNIVESTRFRSER